MNVSVGLRFVGLRFRTLVRVLEGQDWVGKRRPEQMVFLDGAVPREPVGTTGAGKWQGQRRATFP